MKKSIVFLLSSALVFSMATVSMAAASMDAVEVKGDFRYELVKDTTQSAEKTFDNADLRLQFNGKVSDTVSAHLQMRDMMNADDTEGFHIDEYYLTFAQTFGTVKVGFFEWILTPSRVLANSNGRFSLPKSEGTVTFEAPLGANFNFGVASILDAGKDPAGEILIDDNAYDIKLAYKNAFFGAEAHSYDTKLNDENGYAVDVWAKPLDTFKLYAYANTPGGASVEPIVGVQFSNIDRTKLQASFEHATKKHDGGSAEDYYVYGLQMNYQFQNNVHFELEHRSISVDDTVTVFRTKYLF